MIIGIFFSNLPIFWFFTACQPPALTLKRQTYRHVDHIEFENPGLVDDFLAYWRNTGNQRAGFLYGRYERYILKTTKIYLSSVIEIVLM